METSQAGIDEYERFVWRMNPPRITIDNTSSETATLFKVESSNRHGILLDVVQLIVDFQLRIRKAYISSDAGWFMDVFHVTDVSGNKVTDPKILAVIEQTISSSHEFSKPQVGLLPSVEHTVIELTGTDRPGLMSEISALLLHMHCNVVSAELWTHNMRVACLLHITDLTGGPICDSEKLSRIKESLCNVLGGDKDPRGARTDFASGITHSERRMHQLMFADRDYERGCDEEDDRPDSDGRITVENCDEKGYSVVNIECKNRHKLVFDTVCTLTDMQYVVFHATIDTEGPRAYQEYYIRHIDGCTLNSQAERRKLIKCLCAAIERRVTEVFIDQGHVLHIASSFWVERVGYK
ncbi:hypothetical protein KP509_16G009000 [Ceratopteris richardii]|uniref:ACT domain-containing protein n=1 Tax=Ceratopteris richardii TaxID=49495 RepID=A0A8T2SXD3_CERRI|nr:hypothetical protein KP509_16G009000 [Ceratopteris richardii]